MATVHGTMNVSLAEANLRTQNMADFEGWTLVESGQDELVFKKGVSRRSWGSRFTVAFDASSPTETRVTIWVEDTISAFGRDGRAARRLLDLLGAVEN